MALSTTFPVFKKQEEMFIGMVQQHWMVIILLFVILTLCAIWLMGFITFMKDLREKQRLAAPPVLVKKLNNSNWDKSRKKNTKKNKKKKSIEHHLPMSSLLLNEKTKEQLDFEAWCISQEEDMLEHAKVVKNLKTSGSATVTTLKRERAAAAALALGNEKHPVHVPGESEYGKQDVIKEKTSSRDILVATVPTSILKRAIDVPLFLSMSVVFQVHAPHMKEIPGDIFIKFCPLYIVTTTTGDWDAESAVTLPCSLRSPITTTQWTTVRTLPHGTKSVAYKYIAWDFRQGVWLEGPVYKAQLQGNEMNVQFQNQFIIEKNPRHSPATSTTRVVSKSISEESTCTTASGDDDTWNGELSDDEENTTEFRFADVERFVSDLVSEEGKENTSPTSPSWGGSTNDGLTQEDTDTDEYCFADLERFVSKLVQ